MTHASPTKGAERIIGLDVLRGFAVLGILIMNMIFFAMQSANYMNPMAEGDISMLDEMAFWFSRLFANQKFMSLFSILFGAGIVLMTSRVEASGKKPAGRHYLRNFWLLVIGLVHAYIFWEGDILVTYAICALWLFFFRNRKPRTMFIWAGVLYLITMGLSLSSGISMPYWPEANVQELCSSWLPSTEKIASDLEVHRGGWLELFRYRAQTSFYMQTFLFIFNTGWHITGLMLIGMALYKLDIITGKRSRAFYSRMMLIGIGIGLAVGILGLIVNYNKGWTCEFSFLIGSQFNFMGSLPMALGYVGLIMFLCKGRFKGILGTWLAPVGRMALSNYLMQTLIATLIFHGYGLGQFGMFDRAQLWSFILPIWIFQIVFSKWWLTKFRFGPMEWVWRSLTYWELQPMKRRR